MSVFLSPYFRFTRLFLEQPENLIFNSTNWKSVLAKHKKYLTALILLIFLSNCATLSRIPLEPLNEQEAAAIISGIEAQDKMVSSLYTYGSLEIGKWAWESDLNILIAGTKYPLKIKIEITHPWGKPVLYILIIENRLRVLSFSEKKLYMGPFSAVTLAKFFPGEFDPNLIWTAFRKYPSLLSYHKVLSLKANQISLFNEEDKQIETIDFYPESLLPKRVSFSAQKTALIFLDFKEENGIIHAGEVRAVRVKGLKKMVLKSKKTVFNKTIPDQVFTLKKPPAFETVYIN